MASVIDKTDTELVDLVKTLASDEAFLEICRRYENIFFKVCQKYTPAFLAKGLNPQDIFDEKSSVIFHCVSTYQTDRNTKLGTWIGNHARYLCLNTINSQKMVLPMPSEEIKEYIENSQTSRCFFENAAHSQEDFSYILNILAQMRDERILKIFQLRYFSPKKVIWANIAQQLQVSTQTVINLHNKGLKLLKKKIGSKEISDII